MITRKTKVFGISSLLLFIVAATGLFLMWQYIVEKGNELSHQTTEVAQFQAREQAYRELEDLVDQTQGARQELQSYILTEEKTIDFLALIEAIALEQGVELTTNSLKVVEEKGLFDTLVVSYSINGMDERVSAILRLFETLPYHVFVSNVSLQYSSIENIDMTRGNIELTASLLQYDR